MQKWIVLALVALISIAPRVWGQTKPALAPAPTAKVPVDSSAYIPNFSIDLYKERKHMSRADLNPNKPLMIVYFSPKCEHCQHLGDSLAANVSLFKGAQVVMVTFRPVIEVGEYIRLCHLDDAPFFMGSEGLTFLVLHHYLVQTFPFIAVYNKEQKLTAVYRTPPSMWALKQALHSKKAIQAPGLKEEPETAQ
jgi:hypothetical protein